SLCCARAERGQAVADPAINLMKSRRLICRPEVPDMSIVAVLTSTVKGCSMSALGQKRTYAPQQAMSALHPIATAKSGHVRCRSRCPLWVISRHLQCKTACPLHPRKRTCATLIGNRLLGKSAIG